MHGKARSSGMVRTSNGLTITWRGNGFIRDDEHQVLEGIDGHSRVDYDGRVHTLLSGRVRLRAADAPAPDGPYDGWMLDPRSGFRVSWRGMQPLELKHAVAIASLELSGCTVVFCGPAFTEEDRARVGPVQSWLASTGPLMHGEVLFDARTPENLARCAYRAQRADAWELDCGLLLYPAPDSLS